LDKPKTSKHSGGVIVSMPTWSVVDHGFQSLLDKPKTSKHSGGVIVSMPTWSVVDHGYQSFVSMLTITPSLCFDVFGLSNKDWNP
jgi:hypothetical protein